MKEEKIEIEINKGEKIKIGRILLLNEYKNLVTRMPTCHTMIAVCCKRNEKSERDNILAERVAEEIASDNKLFPKMGQDWEKKTIASSKLMTIGNKSYYVIDMMFCRLEHVLHSQCGYDDKKTQRKAEETGRKLLEKALSRFDKRIVEANEAFEKIFNKRGN